jgi:hypothetical protein
MSKERTTVNFGITVPIPAFKRLENNRGYCSRSKFILMALDSLAAATTENKMPLSLQVSRPKETEAIRSLNESTQTPIGVNADA